MDLLPILSNRFSRSLYTSNNVKILRNFKRFPRLVSVCDNIYYYIPDLSVLIKAGSPKTLAFFEAMRNGELHKRRLWKLITSLNVLMRFLPFERFVHFIPLCSIRLLNTKWFRDSCGFDADIVLLPTYFSSKILAIDIERRIIRTIATGNLAHYFIKNEIQALSKAKTMVNTPQVIRVFKEGYDQEFLIGDKLEPEKIYTPYIITLLKRIFRDLAMFYKNQGIEIVSKSSYVERLIEPIISKCSNQEPKTANLARIVAHRIEKSASDIVLLTTVHGDFCHDNIILHEDDYFLLDWEFCRTANLLHDLATFAIRLSYLGEHRFVQALYQANKDLAFGYYNLAVNLVRSVAGPSYLHDYGIEDCVDFYILERLAFYVEQRSANVQERKDVTERFASLYPIWGQPPTE